jgi:hypothetical protein
LCPLSTVPVIYGIGLNYKKHIEESSFPTPEFPVVFTKPDDSLAGPYEDIPIDSRCLNIDYEAELTVIIGKDFKNFKRGDDPLDYILGILSATTCRRGTGRLRTDVEISTAWPSHSTNSHLWDPLSLVLTVHFFEGLCKMVSQIYRCRLE